MSQETHRGSVVLCLYSNHKTGTCVVILSAVTQILLLLEHKLWEHEVISHLNGVLGQPLEDQVIHGVSNCRERTTMKEWHWGLWTLHVYVGSSASFRSRTTTKKKQTELGNLTGRRCDVTASTNACLVSIWPCTKLATCNPTLAWGQIGKAPAPSGTWSA